MNDLLKIKLSLLPEDPGVYRYYDAEGVVIYVGKAKNLKRRVNSYFNREHASIKTARLVSKIVDLQYTVVNTEEEALDLENNLIKEFKPHYNVLLKDDKSYPWIAVTRELYPRVFITRDKVHRGADFYGPYPRVEVAHTLIDTMRRLFPLRTCRHVVSRETIEAQKHRLCLQYHIKNCEGCCRGLVHPTKYSEYIIQVKRILGGDTRLVADYLTEQMMQHATALRFEEAEIFKRRLQLVEHLRSKSVIVSPTIHNLDVYGLYNDGNDVYINFMHLRGGTVVQSLTLEYKRQRDDEMATLEEVMALAVSEIRQTYAVTYGDDRVREVVVNVVPDTEVEGVQWVVPQRGDKRKLLDIALKNARHQHEEHLKMMEKLNPEQRATRTLTIMQRDLHLDCLPRHIECFDNSHIQGNDAVASCVVFRDAKPFKKDYRHYIIKGDEGADDFASMRQVLTRRLTRLIEESAPLPHLIVVDGGKGQITAAQQAMEDVGVDIAVIGLAKRMDEVYFPGDSVPYNLDKNSETIRVLQRLRDEAHRFAITFHRKRRSAGQVNSVLDNIKGVGSKTAEALLKHFKSVKRLREATLEDIVAIVGTSRARAVYDYLHNE